MKWYDHIPSNFLKPVFHKFYMVHSWILCQKIWKDMICLSRPHHLKFCKGCLPQILLGPFLNTLFIYTKMNLCRLWNRFMEKCMFAKIYDEMYAKSAFPREFIPHFYYCLHCLPLPFKIKSFLQSFSNLQLLLVLGCLLYSQN